jgi:uncharacterized membrane protein
MTIHLICMMQAMSGLSLNGRAWFPVRRSLGPHRPFVSDPVVRRADDRLGIRSDAQDSAARGGVMAKADGVFIYIGTYPSEVAARADYDVVKDLHSAGAVGSYDAAVITKDADGKVHVNKDETATRHGTWGGIAAGAFIGLLFPPSILASAAVGGAVGGVSGHLWKGLSRADVKEFGELIDAGQACLLVIGESTIQSALEKAGLKPDQHVQKQVDASSKDVDAAVVATAKQLG